jgi:hypothetical protein
MFDFQQVFVFLMVEKFLPLADATNVAKSTSNEQLIVRKTVFFAETKKKKYEVDWKGKKKNIKHHFVV